MSYSAILGRAAQITWRYKVLWLFGLLASLGNRFQSNVDYDYLPPDLQRWVGNFATSPWVIPVLLFFLLGLPSLLLVMAGLKPLLIVTLPLVLDAPRGMPVTPPTGDLLLGITFGCLLPACCLAVVLAIVLDLLRTLAERVCILEDHGIWESITGGWRLMRAQAGQVAVLWPGRQFRWGASSNSRLIRSTPLCASLDAAQDHVRNDSFSQVEQWQPERP